MSTKPDAAGVKTSRDAALEALESRFDRGRRTVSLFLGPALFVLLLLLPPPGPSPAAQKLTAVVAWVLVYWIGEPIPIAATALLGPTLAVILGIGEPAAVFGPFAHPIIFLFMGSFLLAEAMMTHRLNDRIALSILSVPWLLARSRRLAVGIGVIPLLLSMWISDSATTAMIYPILLGVLAAMREKDQGAGRHEAGWLLTISYAALIGGVGTPVGTPPNLIGVGMLEKLAGRRILFLEWMTLAVPIMLVAATCMFVVMARRFPVDDGAAARTSGYVAERRRLLGPWSRGEKNSLAAFVIAVLLWVGPGIAASVAGPGSDLARFFEKRVPEGIASLAAALLLFVLPTSWKKREFTLEWSQAARIDWGTILLFGGGLSLGGLMFSTGLAEAFGRGIVAASGVTSLWGLTAVAIATAIAMTEVTSNTASASMLVPVVIALAKSMEVSPIPPAVGVCLGASMAFLLPVSTPSNAIVYGSGRVPLTTMMSVGAILDVISFTVIFVGLRVLCPLLGFL